MIMQCNFGKQGRWVKFKVVLSKLTLAIQIWVLTEDLHDSSEKTYYRSQKGTKKRLQNRVYLRYLKSTNCISL